ncbi:MAG: hypothetical protein JXQ72_17555 [Anaerolineae bacterium]|nr:hypothetical protein [Anaerolineae bacterium]
MSTPSNLTNPAPVRKHRRDVRYRIILPVALPALGLVLLCIGLLVAAADGMDSQRITVVMGVVATLFISFPLVLLCVLPYLLLAVTAYGAGKMHASATGPLRAIRRVTERVALKTDEVAPRLARPFGNLSTRVAKWERVLLQLQSPAEQPDVVHKE